MCIAVLQHTIPGKGRLGLLGSVIHTGRKDWRGRVITVCLCLALIFHLATRAYFYGDGTRHKADTLVIYVFSNTDIEYASNLRFFMRFGIEEGDGCDYIFIIQTGEGLEPIELPEAPPNVRFEFHPNGCYDWGTIGWLLQNRPVNLWKYKYFIFLNSSVRGPYIPAYAKNKLRWQQLLVGKLNDKVKLVGATISCEGSPFEGNVEGEWRTNPHVQSYVLATDQVGMKIWLKNDNVFKCYHSMWDVIYYGELGSSLELLEAGYSIDCLMTRYQGVDWSDKNNWGCNGGVNPYGEHFYDGISLHPFEVMFVKVKEKVLVNDWEFAILAKKYEEWMTHQDEGTLDVRPNVWKDDPLGGGIKLPKMAYLRYRGNACFDWQYYMSSNSDLKGAFASVQDAWEHFVNLGAFEGRLHRFTCPMPVPTQ